MYFPSFADFAGDGSFTSRDDSAAAMHFDLNLEKNFGGVFARSSSHDHEVPVHRSLRRVTSEKQLDSLARTTSTIKPSRSGNSVSRSGSSESCCCASDEPVARHLQRPDKGAGSPDSSKLERPARAVLPEWPTVDHNVVDLLSFEIDPTALPTDVLCHLAMEMFVSAGLPAGLAEDRVRRFILAIRASMLDNPYHNFYHVLDVMQTTNALATATGTMARLDAWERFALLSAALCHDMEHPGVTSQFLSKAAGDATRGKYKDIIFRDALLEKHHALRALEFMCDRDVGILEGLSSAQYYQFRSSVSKIILATDIARHAEYVAHLQKFAARRAEDPAAEMDKQLAMELMVKCADVSNVIKPTAVARRWALRVTDEFFGQGDAERAMGMEVSPTCNRLAISRVALQIGFIDSLAGPLFTLLAAAFPPVRNGPCPLREGLEAPLAQLRRNRASYALCTDLELECARDCKDRAAATSIGPSSPIALHRLPSSASLCSSPLSAAGSFSRKPVVQGLGVED
jgi:hypothetical protein